MNSNFYSLADRVTFEDKEKLGIDPDVKVYDGKLVGQGGKLSVKAVSTGEYRIPQAGEWYLSGSVAEAYRAPKTLLSEYYIARLVLVKETTFTALTIIKEA